MQSRVSGGRIKARKRKRVRIIMTMHAALEFQEYDVYSERGVVGVDAMAPFPDAKVQYINHQDGWFFIYWSGDPDVQGNVHPINSKSTNFGDVS